MQSTLIYSPAKSASLGPWLMLLGRPVLFVLFQAAFALGFSVAGSNAPWAASSAWWPFTVALTNLGGLALLLRYFHDEGGDYWQLLRLRREHLRGDLLALLGLLVLAGPASYLPNVLLANVLFGGPQAAVEMMLRPLPQWAAYASLLLFPVTQGLVELPLYFLYVQPRLERQGLPTWLAVAVPAMVLGLQHMAVPLIFDARYLVWRGLMFIPFAFLVGIALRWRPRLMPYMVVVHVLMDLAFALMLIGVAY